MGKTVNEIRKEFQEAREEKFNDYYLELDIDTLKKATALKIIKKREEAFKELQKELYAMMDKIVEEVKQSLESRE